MEPMEPMCFVNLNCFAIQIAVAQSHQSVSRVAAFAMSRDV